MKDMWANIVQKIKQRFDRIKNHPFDFSVLTGSAKPLLIAVAIAILSFLGVDIFYKIISLQVASRQTVGTRQTSAVAAFSGQGNSLEHYNIITQRNLFSTTLKAIVDKNAGGNLLPSEEYTAFDLKGTIAVDQSMGYAIVEEKGKGKQKLYRIGETIGSARLIRITRNTAVLRGGEKEFVMKIREVVESPLTEQSSRADRATSGIALSKQDVTQSLGDLKSIMSQAVVRPFFVEGAQQGFIVSNIVPGSLYQRMGLQNGDVVVDVNNKKLNSADDILQMVNAMQAGGSVSVNLMRKGQNETINYSIQ
jgi:general secretion pathway protein C